MNTTPKDVREMVSECLRRDLDDLLSNQRFTRPDGATRYTRHVKEGSQILDVAFDFRPSYAPGSLAHLLPQVAMLFPEVNKIVLEMVGDSPELAGSRNKTFRQQLQNAAPRDVRNGEATRWMISDPSTAQTCIASMATFLEQWTIPYMNTFSNAESLTRGFENQDERLPQDRQFCLVIAAAYVVIGKPIESMRVLDAKFGKAASRRQYAGAYNFVSRLLAN